MDEQIFGTPNEPTEPTPAVEPGQEPNEPANDDSRFQALAEQIDLTNKAVAGMATQLSNVFTDAANQPAPTPDPVIEPTVPPNTDEFLNDLAQRGSVVVDERVSAGIKEVTDRQFAPVMSTMIETTHDSLLQSQRDVVDEAWGPGTFDEVIMPELSKEITQLRTLNFRSLADKTAIKALVDRHIGLNYRTLKERDSKYVEEKETVAKKEHEDLVSSLPTGGAPRISLREGEIDEDTNMFFKELHAATGDKVDVKKFEGMRGVSSLSDYIKLTAGAKK